MCEGYRKTTSDRGLYLLLDMLGLTELARSTAQVFVTWTEKTLMLWSCAMKLMDRNCRVSRRREDRG